MKKSDFYLAVGCSVVLGAILGVLALILFVADYAETLTSNGCWPLVAAMAAHERQRNPLPPRWDECP